MAERGHRRIGFLCDRAELYTAQARLQGYRDALSALGIAEDPALERANLANPTSVDAAVRELFALSDPPTALFTGQNLITTATLHTLRALGLQSSIAIIGFDDFELADLLDPPDQRRRAERLRARPHRRRAPLRAHRRRHVPVQAGHRSDHADRARLRGDRAVILVAGEALFDLVVSFDGSIEAHPGGAPFNVCCTIARLEREAAFLGALSDDRFGTTLAGALASEGVDLSAVVNVTLARRRSPSPTSTRTGLRPTTSTPTAPRRPRSARRPPLRPCSWRRPRCTWARWDSSSSRSRPPPRRSSTASTAMCSSCSTRTAGPPSRPTARRYLETVAHCARRADVIKVSDEDLAFLALGGDAVQATRSLLRPGAVGLVTRGADVGHDRDRRPDRRRRRAAGDRRRHGRCGRRFRRRVPGLLGRARPRPRGRGRSRAGRSRESASACTSPR